MPGTIKLYQIDAFTDTVFRGNPAAVCPLDKWLPDELMQRIAMENNLAETAFVVKNNDVYDIRWFTPVTEVDLCGHATLAAAFVLFRYEGFSGDRIYFHSPRSGPLTVTRQGDWLLLDFPADTLQQTSLTPDIRACLTQEPLAVFKGKTDYLLVLKNEQDVLEAMPDMNCIAALPARGLIITAPGTDVDFVSRFFGPAVGVPEDPVTGSAHTTLTPYWAEQLGKQELTARQFSQRGGYLRCRHLGGRVEIGGQGILYMKGEIFV